MNHFVFGVGDIGNSIRWCEFLIGQKNKYFLTRILNFALIYINSTFGYNNNSILFPILIRIFKNKIHYDYSKEFVLVLCGKICSEVETFRSTLTGVQILDDEMEFVLYISEKYDFNETI